MGQDGAHGETDLEKQTFPDGGGRGFFKDYGDFPGPLSLRQCVAQVMGVLEQLLVPKLPVSGFPQM